MKHSLFVLVYRFLLLVLFLLAGLLPPAAIAMRQPVEENVQGFLDAQPGPLKSYRDDDQSAAALIQGVYAYYDLSPRVILALLEATSGLLSNPSPGEQALRYPFGTSGPEGFAEQLDWAARELRAGLGPYERAPTVSFSDGTSLTLVLSQAPEGIAVQRFLAKGRTQAEWRTAVDRFGKAFQDYFNNELPQAQPAQPVAPSGFLQRPWKAGTRVIHLAYFDHMFPTVDTGQRGNGFVVNHLGQGNVQYDGHDGHDYYFPDLPIGTYIYAAADGIAYASTHRGNGVWIKHAGGYVTVYWHLDKFAKKFRGLVNTGKGIPVKAGDLLGSSGRSGFVKGTPHLHFEVRHNGRQVDPYGWSGPGTDPCTAYAACEASPWLWSAELAGEFDFTPPGTRAVDRTAPIATLTLNPQPHLIFLADFDKHPLQSVGVGTPTLAGMLDYPATRTSTGVRVGPHARLAFPTANNINLNAGTIALWASIPETFPSSRNGRHYLFAASANPDNGPVYTGTLALRHERLPSGEARWNFWTTPANGDRGRNDLSVPDRLSPGMHHFAITWDRATGRKMLYLDGELVGSASTVILPVDIGDTLEIGRFSPGGVENGVTLDELAIFDRALDAGEIARLAASDTQLIAGITTAAKRDILVDINASDDAGGIMSVQLGIDGVFGDPHPYDDAYRVTLPERSGRYTIAARLFDRAGNSTTVSNTVTLALSP